MSVPYQMRSAALWLGQITGITHRMYCVQLNRWFKTVNLITKQAKVYFNQSTSSWRDGFRMSHNLLSHCVSSLSCVSVAPSFSVPRLSYYYPRDRVTWHSHVGWPFLVPRPIKSWQALVYTKRPEIALACVTSHNYTTFWVDFWVFECWRLLVTHQVQRKDACSWR